MYIYIYTNVYTAEHWISLHLHRMIHVKLIPVEDSDPRWYYTMYSTHVYLHTIITVHIIIKIIIRSIIVKYCKCHYDYHYH